MGIRRPNRQIEVFDISLMAVVTKAMGAFLVIMLLLMPYYRSYPAYQVPASNLGGQLKDLENQIAQLRNQPGANTAALDAANEKLQQAQDQLNKLTEQMNMAWSQTQQAQSQLAQTQQQLQQAQAQTQAVQSQLQQAQAQAQNASAQAAALGSTLNDAVPKPKLLLQIVFKFAPACNQTAYLTYNPDIIGQSSNSVDQAMSTQAPDFTKALTTIGGYSGVFYSPGDDLNDANVDAQMIIQSPDKRRIFFTTAARAGRTIPANCTVSVSITDLLGAAGTSTSLNNIKINQTETTLIAVADMALSPPKFYLAGDVTDADVARYEQNKKCLAEATVNADNTSNLAPRPDCNGTSYPPADASSSPSKAN
jgi:hypothetical protein